VEKAVRVTLRQLRGLFPVDHVIRYRGYLGRELRRGADGVKGMESHVAWGPLG
jgi:hypothetical protein